MESRTTQLKLPLLGRSEAAAGLSTYLATAVNIVPEGLANRVKFEYNRCREPA